MDFPLMMPQDEGQSYTTLYNTPHIGLPLRNSSISNPEQKSELLSPLFFQKKLGLGFLFQKLLTVF